MCGSSSCGGSCVVCKIVSVIVTIVLTFTTVAAFIGVWNTHHTTAGWIFGTPAGSAALFVFIVSLVMWKKALHKCCGCGSKAAGCGCGGACNGKCAAGGVCPACKHNPCTCK
jgi:hypothetical protein